MKKDYECPKIEFLLLGKEDIITLSELLHFNSSNFIGSSITPVLSAAMEPVDL